jgi:transposase
MSRRIPKEIKEEILNKVQAGERVTDLAKQYAVSTKTIYTWFRQDTGEGVVSVLQYNKVEIVRHARLKSVCAQALGINRKNIYRQLKLPAKDHALKQQIEAAHRQHPAYGHRRIAIHLGINHKRAQRVMAKFNLRPPRRHCQ